MVNIAARATRGLKLPSRKQTRNEIKRLFKEQMMALKERLNVSSLSFSLSYLSNFSLQSKVVSGEISLTCDAWQASNADAYFAVTGHWIEEVHNGVRLGQALYKVCARLEIVHKVRLHSNLSFIPLSTFTNINVYEIS